MKIVLFGMSWFNYSNSIRCALEHLGHDVLMIIDDNKGFQSKLLVSNKNKMLEYKPDLFINFCGNYRYNLIDADFLNMIGGIKISIFVDKIDFVGSVEQNFQLYDKVFAFEPSDVAFIKEKYGVDTLLSEVSVDSTVFLKDYGDIDKEYDVSFVGVFTKERGAFFEKIAKFIYEHNLKMIWYGRFWHEKYIWQRFFGKRKFAIRYPYLSKYVNNSYIQPEDAALLYKKSKICLNKHVDRHQGMSYRVFEIMANGNFHLCDERVQAKDYGLIDKENIVFYKDVQDCIDKIEYYLENDKIREKIAQNGSILVKERYTSEKVMQRLLDCIF